MPRGEPRAREQTGRHDAGMGIGGWARACGCALLIGAVASLAACAPSGPPAPAAPSPTAAASAPAARPTAITMPGLSPRPLPPGVGVEIRQARVEWGEGIVRAHVVNETGEDLAVSSAQISGDRWSTPAVSLDPVVVGSGGEMDVRMLLGEPRCEGGEQPPVDVLTLHVGAGGAESGAVISHRLDALADPDQVLASRWAEGCAAAAVARGAALSWSALDVVDGPAGLRARLTLRLDPVPEGPAVTVTGVDPTTLLSPAAGPQWDLGLDNTADGPATATLDAVPARCDPHAVAEDKRGWQMPVRASVDGVPQAVFYLPLPDDARAALHAFIGEACGWPDG